MTRSEFVYAIELLKKLVYGPTPTVFSGGSLQLLFTRLQDDLSRIPEDREEVILRHWERNLTKFQAALFEHAEQAALIPGSHPAFTSGSRTVFVTEKSTGAAFGVCPPPPKLP